MKCLAAFGIFCATVSIFAQTPQQATQSCPVKVTLVRPRYKYVTHDTRIHIRALNDSTKVVIGVKFGLYTLDAVNDKHEYPEMLVLSDSYKPAKEASEDFTVTLQSEAEGARGAIVWTQKVLFADGTSWEDDGSRSCQLLGR